MKQGNAKVSRARHLLAIVLAACMLLQCGMPVFAAPETQESPAGVTLKETTADAVTAETTLAGPAEPAGVEEQVPADTDMVRVSIVLDAPSPIRAGYSTAGIADNQAAMSYRAELRQTQEEVAEAISDKALDGAALDVVWNLTLAVNLISANVPYGAIENIEAVPGVSAVYVETRYDPASGVDTAEPNMLSSEQMTGTPDAWTAGYSGAGSRIAVIDTGIDLDHQSFDPEAYEYALLLQGAEAVKEKKFKTVDEYLSSLELLDTAQIASVLPDLNAYARYAETLTADDLYWNSKVPYGFNYVDSTLDVTHENDIQGEHGSHVSGITAANRYIPSTGNDFVPAEETAHMIGQAPEAQLLVMKVFGTGGGAYDSDYVAAIEDALMLDCDAVNLSLGTTAVGYTYSGNAYYDSVFASLAGSDTVVSISAGNNGSWSESAYNGTGLLYADDVNNNRVGSPSAYPNSISVASVDNTGFTGPTTVFNGELTLNVTEAGSTPPGYQVWTTLDKSEDGTGSEYPYVFLGDPSPMLDPDYEAPSEGAPAPDYLGAEEDYEDMSSVSGKIVLVARGDLSFALKHQYGAAAGAAAVLVYDNSDSNISMDISASTERVPCAIISLSSAKKLFAITEKDESGEYSGTARVSAGIDTTFGDEDAAMTMSSFSSFGVPENLELKPEITAPGGGIYSVNGYHGVSQNNDGSLNMGGGHSAYENMSGTSMAAPQVAGMTADVMQYIKDNDLDTKTGLPRRTLAQSLLMSTAVPITDAANGLEYSVRRQGSGLANVGNAVNSATYILVGPEDGNDGKVKAEFGDDPQREGSYGFTFTVYNLTNAPQNYALRAQIMAPGTETIGGTVYMADTMVKLSPSVRVTTGSGYDVDQNGRIDDADVQALLDTLARKGKTDADLNGDGAVDAYDAYLLMLYVQSAGESGDTIVSVPAYGQTEVNVTVTLSEADRKYIEDNFPNGTFVEGYIYLDAQADPLGAIGVSHSIPMLAFYGSWSEGSMYERGSYIEDANNPSPEAHYANTEPYANYVISKFSGQSYYYGLNLYAKDDEYLPERASISTALGGAIQRVGYTLIRNSAGGRVTVTNTETGDVYVDRSVDQQYSAFYNTSSAAWSNVSASASVNWKGTDAEGAPLPDGTRAEVKLVTASEYYRNADGTIDWDAIDGGAVISVPVLIDNEKPVILNAEHSEDIITGAGSLKLSVQDNHYVAAVLMLNETGSAVIKRIPINQTEEGVQTDLDVSLEGVIGTRFILMVVDYAGNANYYDTTINNVGSTGGFYAFNTDNGSWVNFGEDVDRNETVKNASDRTYVSGEYAKGYIFAVDGANGLYALPLNDLTHSVRIRTLYSYEDLAFNESDQNMYALRNAGSRGSYVYTIGLLYGDQAYSFKVEQSLHSLAWAGGDQFYAIGADGLLYKLDMSARTAEQVGETKLADSVTSAQSTIFDVTNHILYWANGNKLCAIHVDDPQSESFVTEVGTLSGASTTCLCYYPSMNGESIGDGSLASGLSLTGGNREVLIGDMIQLQATIRPWFVSDPTVLWSSDDAQVATVDQNGLVKTVGEGTATITATSQLTPSISATTTITVKTMDERISGVVMNNGQVEIYDRSFHSGEIATQEVAGMDSLIASTYDPVNKALWAMDADATLYRIDEGTGEILQTVPSGSALPVYDMEYSTRFGGFWSIYGSYILVPTPFEENAPGSGFDFTPYLSQQGASQFVAVASMGNTTYQGQQCEQLILLDDGGGFWNVLIYSTGNSFSAYLSAGTTGMGGKYTTVTNNSAMYDRNYDSGKGGILVSVNNGSNSTIYAFSVENTTNVKTLGSTPSGATPLCLYRTEPDPAVSEDTGSARPVPFGGEMFQVDLELTAVRAQR